MISFVFWIKRLKRIKLQTQINPMIPPQPPPPVYMPKESIQKLKWFKIIFFPISTLKESTHKHKWFRSVSRKLHLLCMFISEARLQRTKYTRTKETTNYRNRVCAGQIPSVQTVVSDEPNESPEIKGVTMRANLKSLPLLSARPVTEGSRADRVPPERTRRQLVSVDFVGIVQELIGLLAANPRWPRTRMLLYNPDKRKKLQRSRHVAVFRPSYRVACLGLEINRVWAWARWHLKWLGKRCVCRAGFKRSDSGGEGSVSPTWKKILLWWNVRAAEAKMPRVLLRGFVVFETNFEAEKAVAYRRRCRDGREPIKASRFTESKW